MQTQQATPALLELDSPEATIQHAELIRKKRLLRDIYQEHYEFFARELSAAPEGVVLELGSGGGFLKQVIPGAVTSDVVAVPTADMVLSALSLPFPDTSLRGVVMMNVLHHLQDVELFFDEVQRCLKPGGRVVMVEPANTLFSNFIYRNFHHEPFEPKQEGWKLPPGGRMSSANDALPWMIFCRDRARFEAQYPELRVDRVDTCLPFRYILSGGVSKPQILPNFCNPLLKAFEFALTPLNPLLALFMRVTLTRQSLG